MVPQPQPKPPCCVIDHFLTKHELHHLQTVFADTSSSYWTEHNYNMNQEPPAPYFSYVIQLNPSTPNHQQQQQHGFLQTIIHKILTSPTVQHQFPTLRQNTHYVELWAHNRPHASGHQLHFDSDDEGRTTDDDEHGPQRYPRHPLVSTVLYVSTENDVGGPTLVTDQRLRNPTTRSLGSVQGWLVPSKPSRLVCFDGGVLHGVVPGKGVVPSCPSDDPEGGERRPRRVSVMMAFWKHIEVREGSGPGSARLWPTPSTIGTTLRNKHKKLKSSLGSSFSSSSCSVPLLPSWAMELNRTDLEQISVTTPRQGCDDDPCGSSSKPNQPQIVPIGHVYELLDGTPVPKYKDGVKGEYYMPEYDRVFQGF